MDTSDPEIVFNDRGESDYYTNFIKNILPHWDTGQSGHIKLMKTADKIRKENKGRDFDCIIGLSGGLDSSYTAYVAKEIMGLRPLIFHVDAGWNTTQAVSNIEKLLNGLNVDLFTEVIDWEEMKDLQLAFLKSQIPDQDLPQDAAFFSSLYRFARKYKIKYVLTGGNYSTECCREPEAWGGYIGIDVRLFRDIHQRFGKIKLRTFPLVDILDYKIFYRYGFGIKVIKPLNNVPFIKNDAERTLFENFGWEKYQNKHHESVFTRFYEDYWLPRKFGFDRRRVHFSSLILTGQMTREAALDRLMSPEMSEEFLSQEFEYVATKLDLTVDGLRQIFSGENKTFSDYKSKEWIINSGAKVMRFLGYERRLYR